MFSILKIPSSFIMFPVKIFPTCCLPLILFFQKIFSPWSLFSFTVSFIILSLGNFITPVKPHDHTSHQNANAGRIQLVKPKERLQSCPHCVQGVCVNADRCHWSGRPSQDPALTLWTRKPERPPSSRWRRRDQTGQGLPHR